MFAPGKVWLTCFIMDGDPAVESEIDSFSLVLPLPYRVAIIIVLGIWAWGVNLHYLHLVKIVCAATNFGDFTLLTLASRTSRH